MAEQRYTIADFLNARTAQAPRFSPSGDQLCFLSDQDSDTQQVWVVRPDGSGAHRITDFTEAVTAEWSPSDEDVLLLAKDTKGDEQHQLLLLRISSGEVTALTDDPAAKHAFGGWTLDGRWLAYSSNAANGTDFDVYVRDLHTQAERVVFGEGGASHGVGFSPSGRFLVVSRHSTNVDNDLYLVDLEEPARPLLMTPHDGSCHYRNVSWLPDEAGFFLISDQDGETDALWFFEMADRRLTLVKRLAWDIEEICLNRPGDRLVVVVNEEGYSRPLVYGVGADLSLDELPHEFPHGMISGLTWDAGGTHLAFSACAHDTTFNVWLWDAVSGRSRRLTDAPVGVPSRLMAEPQLVHVPSFDGLMIPAFLYLPADRTGPHPVVVNIHGGPESQFRPSFAPWLQYLVHRGYAVLSPNVRGSAGYGKAYMALDDRHKRLDSVRDLEALHRWAEQEERLDANRMALHGGSYGGYMVLAGLAFQPDIWAAGVDMVGIANLETFLENTSAYRRALREAEYGYLATDREFLRAASPIHRADDIRAPLFIVHGGNDPRVPLSEAEQIRDKLAARGVITKMLVYGDEGHGLSKITNRLDAFAQVADFLDDVLRPPTSPPEAALP